MLSLSHVGPSCWLKKSLPFWQIRKQIYVAVQIFKRDFARSKAFETLFQWMNTKRLCYHKYLLALFRGFFPFVTSICLTRRSMELGNFPPLDLWKSRIRGHNVQRDFCNRRSILIVYHHRQIHNRDWCKK